MTAPQRSGGLRLASGLLVAAVLAACAGPSVREPRQVVRIGASNRLADAPTKVAQALGLFGPDVEVVSFDTGEDAFHAMLEGRIDFCTVAPTPVAIAWSNGREAQPKPAILASLALSSRTHWVVAARERGIVVPDDMRGRRLGLPRGTSAEHAAWQLLVREGISPEAVVLVDMPVASLTAAVLDGRVDAAVTWDPHADALRTVLGDGASVFSVQGMQSVNWFLATTRERARQSPELADRVLRAYLRAVDTTLSEPDTARAFHSQLAGVSEEDLAPLEERVIWSVGLDWSVLANMAARFEWLRARGALVGEDAPGPRDYIDAGALLRVAPGRVHLPAHLRGARASGGTT